MMTTTNEKPKPKKGTHHINDDEAKEDSNMALIHLEVRDRQPGKLLVTIILYISWT